MINVQISCYCRPYERGGGEWAGGYTNLDKFHVESKTELPEIGDKIETIWGKHTVREFRWTYGEDSVYLQLIVGDKP